MTGRKEVRERRLLGGRERRRLGEKQGRGGEEGQHGVRVREGRVGGRHGWSMLGKQSLGRSQHIKATAYHGGP